VSAHLKKFVKLETFVGRYQLEVKESLDCRMKLPHPSPKVSLRDELVVLYRLLLKCNRQTHGGKDFILYNAVLTTNRNGHWILAHVLGRAYDKKLPDVEACNWLMFPVVKPELALTDQQRQELSSLLANHPRDNFEDNGTAWDTYLDYKEDIHRLRIYNREREMLRQHV